MEWRGGRAEFDHYVLAMEWSSTICVQTNHYCSSSGCCLYSVGIISATASGAARPTAITAGAGMMLASTSADPGEDKTPGTAGVGCHHLCFLSTAIVDHVIPTLRRGYAR